MQIVIGIIVTTVLTDDSDHEGHLASAKSMNLDDNPYITRTPTSTQ